MTLRKDYFRTLLVLGRTSNLPTVWSNCLAATIFVGGYYWDRVLLAWLAGSFLYLGGMFLNDAFDSDFDRQFRRERPIPSGAITEKEVWIWGSALLLAGIIVCALINKYALIFSLLLTASILLYNAVHKLIAFSPVLMALCRFFLYLTAAASVAPLGWGYSMWPALALAFYIIGLSYIARKETGRGIIHLWPSLLLAFPLIISFVTNDGPYRKWAIIWAILFIAWTLYCLHHTYWSEARNVPRTVTGLLAGIILVDALLLGTTNWPVFLALFTTCRIAQRFIPAT